MEDHLSDAEMEIVELMSCTLTNDAISREIGLTTTEVQRVLTKLYIRYGNEMEPNDTNKRAWLITQYKDGRWRGEPNINGKCLTCNRKMRLVIKLCPSCGQEDITTVPHEVRVPATNRREKMRDSYLWADSFNYKNVVVVSWIVGKKMDVEPYALEGYAVRVKNTVGGWGCIRVFILIDGEVEVEIGDKDVVEYKGFLLKKDPRTGYWYHRVIWSNRDRVKLREER